MVSENDVYIIGIAGGTGSGKSTFTNRIKEALGDKVTIIYHDNYYRRQDELPFEERKKVTMIIRTHWRRIFWLSISRS